MPEFVFNLKQPPALQRAFNPQQPNVPSVVDNTINHPFPIAHNVRPPFSQSEVDRLQSVLPPFQQKPSESSTAYVPPRPRRQQKRTKFVSPSAPPSTEQTFSNLDPSLQNVLGSSLEEFSTAVTDYDLNESTQNRNNPIATDSNLYSNLLDGEDEYEGNLAKSRHREESVWQDEEKYELNQAEEELLSNADIDKFLFTSRRRWTEKENERLLHNVDKMINDPSKNEFAVANKVFWEEVRKLHKSNRSAKALRHQWEQLGNVKGTGCYAIAAKQKHIIEGRKVQNAATTSSVSTIIQQK